jgi:peptide/nickel transport system permease protein
MLIFAMLSLLSPYERAALYVRDVPKRQGAIEEIIAKYGLADPIHVQYIHWMFGRIDEDSQERVGGVLFGDLGFSKVGKARVSEVIAFRLPATVELALWAGIPMVGIGIWLGVVSATKHNRLTDQILRVFSIVGGRFPSLFSGCSC